MLRNQRDGLYHTILDIAHEPGIVRIRIFNKEGRISFSSDTAEIDTLVDKRAEQENAVERAMVVARGPELQQEDFTLQLPLSERSVMTLEEVQRDHILKVIELCESNQTLAADVLGIDRVTLHTKLKKYGWQRPGADNS